MTTEASTKVMFRHALLLAMMSEDPDEAMSVLLGPAARVPAPPATQETPPRERDAG